LSPQKYRKKHRNIILDSDSEDVESVKVVEPPKRVQPAASTQEKKKVKLTEEIDPKSFFTSSKIKQSDKTQVTVVKTAPKVKEHDILIDDDDDLILLDEINKTESIIKASSSPEHSENLQTNVSVLKKSVSKQPLVDIDLTMDDSDSIVNAASPKVMVEAKKTPVQVLKKDELKKASLPKEEPVVKKESIKKEEPVVKKETLKKDVPAVKKEVVAKKPEKNSSPLKEEGEEETKKKFNYFAYKAKKESGPKAPGSKEIPEGAENCLLNLSFVFTGDLSSLSRDQASDLVKVYNFNLHDNSVMVDVLWVLLAQKQTMLLLAMIQVFFNIG
jgi:BRCT domain type II-containing protein